MKKITASDSRQSVGLKWKLRKSIEDNISFDGNKTKFRGDLNVYDNFNFAYLPMTVATDDIYDGIFSFESDDFTILFFGNVRSDTTTNTYFLDSGFGYSDADGRLFMCQSGDMNKVKNGALDVGDGLYLDAISKDRFIHHVTVTTSAGAYKFSYRSDSDVNCSSVSDLRTVMHISASGDEEAIACCKSDWTATGCFHITTAICQVGSANVTAVSDKVVAE